LITFYAADPSIEYGSATVSKIYEFKIWGLFVGLKNEMPYIRAFPAFFHYSSSVAIFNSSFVNH
jgi:hypothetical protein